jgi:hydroxymethylpyrimidine pyrophosphatase-like HAD family hydrolase
VEPSFDGPVCALDVDGVVETEHLGFAAITPVGAKTLRALTRHGFRVILVSGRSLAEIRDRCVAYGLPGGVAEYGAVAFETGQDADIFGLECADKGRLHRLGQTLQAMPGIYMDEQYEHSVRAYRFDSTGRRRGLDSSTIRSALERSGTDRDLRPVVGGGQTDFVPARISKATGMQMLLGTGSIGSRPLALVVGDTVSDLPVLEMARIAAAPANAQAALPAAGVRLARLPYQAGLAEAASWLLGHAPGNCPVCRFPPLPPEANILLTVLGGFDHGSLGRLRQTLLLAARLVISAK